jgi:hypothetical protein
LACCEMKITVGAYSTVESHGWSTPHQTHAQLIL